MSWGWSYKPYVTVGERRRRAEKEIAKSQKKGKPLSPIEIEGRKIASSFWGKAWCDNLESYSDFANRLPRGRTYVRNGSVIDLRISSGTIESLVNGSELYRVTIDIDPVKKSAWKVLKKECSGQVNSLFDLLQGRLSTGVMETMTRRETGLFPKPKEIRLKCSCPDWAGMCKHVAATLYGVGARLDESPELLFLLRSVDHAELISDAADSVTTTDFSSSDHTDTVAEDHLAEVFGIEIESFEQPAEKKVVKKTRAKQVSKPVKKGGRKKESAEKPPRSGQTKKPVKKMVGAIGKKRKKKLD
jgi:uncharacterized Zn finger protein